MDIRDEKRGLRREIRAALDELTAEYIERSGAAIAEKLTGMPEYAAAKTVFCYASAYREPDTRAIMLHAMRGGKRVCAPLCTGPGVMEMRVIGGLSELTRGAFGLPEPPRNAPALKAGDIDLAVIPCLSCGYDGRRLGKGGGYYDRFLEVYSGVAAALCFGALMREGIPMEAHDRTVEYVITEKGIYGPACAPGAKNV